MYMAEDKQSSKMHFLKDILYLILQLRVYELYTAQACSLKRYLVCAHFLPVYNLF